MYNPIFRRSCFSLPQQSLQAKLQSLLTRFGITFFGSTSQLLVQEIDSENNICIAIHDNYALELLRPIEITGYSLEVTLVARGPCFYSVLS